MKVMRLSTIAALFAFVLFVLDSQAQQTDLEIEGSIVMYDSLPPSAGALNTAGGTSTFLVKISKIISGQETSEYILMITGRTFSKSQFNLKKTLLFNLKRAPVFDGKIKIFDGKIKNYLDLDSNEKNDERKIVTRLLLSKGVILGALPLEETLPAYYFRGNDYTVK